MICQEKKCYVVINVCECNNLIVSWDVVNEFVELGNEY